ncbi:MAG: hypothetical protein CVU05_06795 [Bacteroidetes bacterium HGW-Bacteroidetes-21]|jgi:peptidoglycan/LPS O-acetylase OafA/YrhL|nr:MAG: hypothetical protein CVU05_06795 [Bacteroidetes bacterium HGW-Bacteroidetes-21]
MTFTFRSLSKKETSLLKAIAIIMIAFHNYFRWVNPICGENEFSFVQQNLFNFFDGIGINWLQFINLTFNYLGHFGVQIFIFLSAYGLTISTNDKPIHWGSFVWSRFKKLYPIFVGGAILYVLFFILRTGNLPQFSVVKDILIQLSLTANLIPDKAMVITGPWWFFSLIFQFYIVFPLLIIGFRKYKSVFLFIVGGLALVILYTCNRFALQNNLNILQTFLGHLPEFVLGIGLASYKQTKILWFVTLTALAAFLLSNYFEWAWLLGFVSFTLVFFWFYSTILSKLFAKRKFAFLVFIGNISVYIFVVHGFLRDGFLGIGNSMNNPVLGILGSLSFFIFVIIVAYGMQKSDEALKQVLYGKTAPFAKKLIVLIPVITIALFIGYYYYAVENFKKLSLSIPEKTIESSAEELSLDKGNIISSGTTVVNMSNAMQQDSTIFKTGKFSFLTDSSCQFAPSCILENPTACQKITVSVWRKSSHIEQGSLVISIPETGYYVSTNTPYKSENGWDLLTISTELPCNILKQEVKVYCWNSSTQKVNFDDFSVVYR